MPDVTFPIAYTFIALALMLAVWGVLATDLWTLSFALVALGCSVWGIQRMKGDW